MAQTGEGWEQRGMQIYLKSLIKKKKTKIQISKLKKVNENQGLLHLLFQKKKIKIKEKK